MHHDSLTMCKTSLLYDPANRFFFPHLETSPKQQALSNESHIIPSPKDQTPPNIPKRIMEKSRDFPHHWSHF